MAGEQSFANAVEAGTTASNEDDEWKYLDAQSNGSTIQANTSALPTLLGLSDDTHFASDKPQPSLSMSTAMLDDEVEQQDFGGSDDEDQSPGTLQPGPEQKRQAERRTFEDWVRNTAVNDAFQRGHVRHDGIEQTMTVRSLAARSESAEIINNPRDYQLELFQCAKKDNVIAVLDTGTGKTLIAVLLIRWTIDQELESIAKGNSSRTSFFLVPTVNLVIQQTAVLETNLAQAPGSFYGDIVDSWDKKEWNKIMEEHRAIVCTADILLDALAKSFVKMTQINLLIFDEAHHVKSNHPYACIMRDHYLVLNESDRPRVFGMTASPVDAKANIEQIATRLETIMNSRIITTGNLTSLQSLRRPKEETMFYTVAPQAWNSPLAQDITPRVRHLPRLRVRVQQAEAVAVHLGLWCADQHMLRILESGPRKDLERRLEKDYSLNEDDDITSELDETRSEYHAVLQHMELYHKGNDGAGLDVHYSDKVATLKRILDREFEVPTDNRCMVFVTEKRTAYLLNALFAQIGLPAMRCGYIVGASQANKEELAFSLKQQMLTLHKFRNGDLNCLFSTPVAEEGLDIPACNLVVRFDLYGSMIQYIQSRGRARQNESKFVHMINSNEPQQSQLKQDVISRERTMRSWCSTLPDDRRLLSGERDTQQILNAAGQTEKCFDKESGAVLTFGNALRYLNTFVSAIPTNSPEMLHPTFVIVTHGTQFIAEVILPDDAPVKSMLGEPWPRKLLAKCSAAFHLCVKLRELEYLDCHWTPTYTKRLPEMRNALLAAGIEKQDVYPSLTKPITWKSLSGSLPTRLWMVAISFPDGFEYEHANLIMLTAAKMPDFPSFPLVRNDRQQSQVVLQTLSQPIDVTLSELEQLTAFTLRIFADIFSKTYEARPEQLPYFITLATTILPMDVQAKEYVDWSLMRDILDSDPTVWSPGCDTTIMLQKLLLDKYDGSRKLISHKIHETLQPSDKVPEDAAPHRHHTSILEYSSSLYRGKRDLKKWTPGQPVIVADKLRLRRDMLSPPGKGEAEQRIKAYICPEPFAVSMLPVAFAVSCLAWPSIIWRLESVLIALEACQSIGITCEPHLALAAITKDSSIEREQADNGAMSYHSGMGENYERLEFLGDCFLKLASTLAVFVKSPDKDEFGLHVARMLLLCNKTLYETSVQRGLPKYIRASPFSRRLWYPEGLKLVAGKGKNEEHDVYNTKKQSLSQKSIADVSEALIGAAFISHNKPECWSGDMWQNAITAVTRLVGSDDHPMTKWQDYVDAYEMPEYQIRRTMGSLQKDADMIEQALGYHFNHPALLRSAMTHGSWPFSEEKIPSYERLEFLGDALLDMAVITNLFSRFPDKDEQWLTEAKAAVVGNRFLGALSCKLGFHKYLRHTTAALGAAIRDYVYDHDQKVKTLGMTRNYWQHVQEPPKCLADILEAYVGAMFIDSNFNYAEVQRFFDEHIKWHFEDMSLYSQYVKGQPTTRFISALSRLGCRDFRLMTAEVPSITRGDRKELVVGIMVHGCVIAHSIGTSSRYASERAAHKAREVIEKFTMEEYKAEYGCDCGSKAKMGNELSMIDGAQDDGVLV